MRIKLLKYDKPDPASIRISQKRYYSIVLPGRIEKFKQEKQVKHRLVELSKILNTHALDTNHLVSEVYSEFRAYWFHLDSVHSLRIRTSFNSIDKAMHIMVTRSAGYGNHFVFSQFHFILTELAMVLNGLAALSLNNTNGPQRYRLKSLEQRINYIQERLAEITGTED